MQNAQNLQAQVTRVLNQAFPAGIPGVKKTVKGKPVQNEIDGWAGFIFPIYDPYHDKDEEIGFSMSEAGKFNAWTTIPADGQQYFVEEIMPRAKLAAKHDHTDLLIDMHEFMEQAAKLLGSEKGFGEKKPNNRQKCYVYMAYGAGGRIRIIANAPGAVHHVEYRSGPMKRTDHINICDFEHAKNYLAALASWAKVSKVWHVGASAITKEFIDNLPIHTFRQKLTYRPSYHYDFPFCDVVLENHPDVIVLRANVDGYCMWKDGKFIQGVTDLSELVAEPLDREVTAEYPQQLWRHGTGLLYTIGTYEKLEGVSRGVKFTPVKVRG